MHFSPVPTQWVSTFNWSCVTWIVAASAGMMMDGKEEMCTCRVYIEIHSTSPYSVNLMRLCYAAVGFDWWQTGRGRRRRRGVRKGVVVNYGSPLPAALSTHHWAGSAKTTKRCVTLQKAVSQPGKVIIFCEWKILSALRLKAVRHLCW